MTDEKNGVESQPELAERIARAKNAKASKGKKAAKKNGKAKKEKSERKPSPVAQYLSKDNEKSHLREYKCPYAACEGKTINGPWSFKQHLLKQHDKEV